MRRLIFALVGLAALASCAGSLQLAYDDRARDECDNNSGNYRSHQDCYDAVDRNSRAHRDR